MNWLYLKRKLEKDLKREIFLMIMLSQDLVLIYISKSIKYTILKWILQMDKHRLNTLSNWLHLGHWKDKPK